MYFTQTILFVVTLDSGYDCQHHNRVTFMIRSRVEAMSHFLDLVMLVQR